MTELVLADWDAAVQWYRGVLGLRSILHDPARGFALLGDDRGKLALKAGRTEPTDPPGVRLSFLVSDLDATLARLRALGVAADEIAHDAREGFRSFRVMGPERTPITIFAWDQPDTSGRT